MRWVGLGLVGVWVAAQPLVTNTGVPLALESGGIVWCEGGWRNDAGGTFTNSGRVHIQGDLQNDDGGQFFLPAPTPGALILNGTTQTLSGSFPIRTDTLILEGNSPKILATDLYVDRLLALGDAELRTQGRFAAVRNPAPAAITRQNGFVSSDPGGYLERATDQSAVYLFPVGGHTPLRYRPVEIIPASAAAHRYAVRLANADPNTENRPRDQRHPDLCEINPLYHHYIHRLGGNDAAEVRVYYQAGDPVTGPLAQWKAALWVPTTATAIPSGWALTGWTDYTDPYFAFSQERTQVSLNVSEDTVEVGQVVQLSASAQPSAATYSWNLGDGTTLTGAATQNHAYSQPGVYTVAVIAPPCSDTAFRQIVVVEPSTITLPTAFTPNGDGVNDFWRPIVQGQLRRMVWRIFDRWGILVATGNGTSARWDGTKNGQPCPEGAYVFIVELETLGGKQVIRTGTVTLLR